MTPSGKTTQAASEEDSVEKNTPSIATKTTEAGTATTDSLVMESTEEAKTTLPPVGSILFQKLDSNKSPPEPDAEHRAIHRVCLSALSHNYGEVELAANRQRCSVIVVVKADGYGHGAIATALHLADDVGADAFAVATLEEGIALRRAFQSTASASANPSVPGGSAPAVLTPSHSTVTTLFQDIGAATEVPSTVARNGLKGKSKRPSHVRILVLGPPVGFPRCFDDYYHHGIEVIVSGPEVARSLVEWVMNTEERKRTQVERAANEMKAQALQGHPSVVPSPRVPVSGNNSPGTGSVDSEESTGSIPEKSRTPRPASATLGNVSGQDLAKEVRAILINQQKEKAAAEQQQQQELLKEKEKDQEKQKKFESKASSGSLESLSKSRKRLRWHALVDSGMGRLGFRTDTVSNDEQEERQDSVAIIKELVDMEAKSDCPIEFYGMCTHMADASSTSDYTNSQIAKFKDLLRRVRASGITVPTVSTDNSAALLTTSLNHFDADELLGPENDAQTQGFVRVGGAIYGQRPTFRQLRAVSTLMASVRHVATLKKGESVGYDRNYIAPFDVRIATLTIGFADGYPRELGNGIGKVEIRGNLFKIAGNVCMDMLMVELGPAEDQLGIGSQVIVGDTAILWGPAAEDDINKGVDGDYNDGYNNGNTSPNSAGLVRLQDVAGTLNTTQSAVTCGLDKVRVLRQYG